MKCLESNTGIIKYWLESLILWTSTSTKYLRQWNQQWKIHQNAILDQVLTGHLVWLYLCQSTRHFYALWDATFLAWVDYDDLGVPWPEVHQAVVQAPSECDYQYDKSQKWRESGRILPGSRRSWPKRGHSEDGCGSRGWPWEYRYIMTNWLRKHSWPWGTGIVWSKLHHKTSAYHHRMRVIAVMDLISTYLVVSANDKLLAAQSVCEEAIELASEMLKCQITDMFLFQAFNGDSGHAGAMNYTLECVFLLSNSSHASLMKWALNLNTGEIWLPGPGPASRAASASSSVISSSMSMSFLIIVATTSFMPTLRIWKLQKDIS